jgi:hypothetical protein
MPTAINNPALGSLQNILVYNIKVDDLSVNLSDSELINVEIGNSENSHEYALITTQLSKSQIKEFVDKTISFTYGKTSQTNNFYGYVVSISPNKDYQKDTTVDIYCMGTTWHMQSGNPKFIVGKTVPDAFDEVVRPYNLGVQADSHPYKWPALAQSAESDWQFLQLIASKIGYCIYNYRGIVRLVDPVRILTTTGIYRSYLQGDDVIDPTRGLYDWSATSQSLQVRDSIKPSFGYFEGAFPSKEGQPKPQPALSKALTTPYKLNTSSPISNSGMAKTYSDAWNRRVDYWDQQATARINGDALLVPGVNVSVQVSGARSAPNEYDGTWLVREVKHSLSHNSFQTLVSLSRDTRVTPVNTDFRWFWSVPLSGSPDQPRPNGAPLVTRKDVGSTSAASSSIAISTADQPTEPPFKVFWESSWKGLTLRINNTI